jgi:hypothetical protein
MAVEDKIFTQLLNKMALRKMGLFGILRVFNIFLDGRGSIPCSSKTFLHSFPTALGPTQPPIQWGSGVFSPGVKRPGHVVDYSPPSSAEVKNGRTIPPSPSRLDGMVLN